MPIKVSFRGPMLFVSDKASENELNDVVDRVVIPDATSIGKHGDGSDAKPHVAGLLLIEKGRPQVYIPLGGRKVEISADGENGLPKVNKDFLGVPPIHQMTNPKASKTPPIKQRSALNDDPTIITFNGGSMGGEMKIEKKMELTRHGDTPVPWVVTSMPFWQSGAARGTIKLSGGDYDDETITLTPEVTVYIYNWDTAFPTDEILTLTTDVTNMRSDEDFKWVYALLKPDGGKTWKQWLNGEPLPTPRVADTAGAFTPPLSTCNSARVSGMPLV